MRLCETHSAQKRDGQGTQRAPEAWACMAETAQARASERCVDAPSRTLSTRFCPPRPSECPARAPEIAAGPASEQPSPTPRVPRAFPHATQGAEALLTLHAHLAAAAPIVRASMALCIRCCAMIPLAAFCDTGGRGSLGPRGQDEAMGWGLGWANATHGH